MTSLPNGKNGKLKESLRNKKSTKCQVDKMAR